MLYFFSHFLFYSPEYMDQEEERQGKKPAEKYLLNH